MQLPNNNIISKSLSPGCGEVTPRGDQAAVLQPLRYTMASSAMTRYVRFLEITHYCLFPSLEHTDADP
jgi:hypothetical protein